MAKLSENQAYEYLVAKGYKPHEAAGIVGNISHESGLDSGVSEKNPATESARKQGGGFGLAQWTGPRRKALEQYATANKSSADDPYTQLDYLDNELSTTHKGARQALAGTTDPKSAALIFSKTFERPAAKYAHNDRRTGIAERVFNAVIPSAQADDGFDYSNYKEVSKDTGFDFANYKEVKPENQTNILQAAANGAADYGTAGFADEIAGGLGAVASRFDPELKNKPFGEVYRGIRDAARETSDTAYKEHPAAYVAGAVPATILSPINKVGGKIGQSGGAMARIGGASAQGAISGAAYGAGMSKADSVGGVAKDTATGAAIGGVAGGVLKGGYEAAKGVTKGAVVPIAQDIHAAFSDDAAAKMAAKKVLSNETVAQSIDYRPIGGGQPQPAAAIPGAKFTAAMKSKDPAIIQLEMAARTRNTGGKFSGIDDHNLGLIYDKLQKMSSTPANISAAKTKINQLTGPLRDDAMQAAKLQPQKAAQPVIDAVSNLQPYLHEEKMAAHINKVLQSVEGNPEELPNALYALKKDLSDRLKSKGLDTDATTNAIKNDRVLTSKIISAIDDGLNDASNGAWQKYNDVYSKAIKKVNSKSALAEKMAKFETNPDLVTRDGKSITSYQLKKAAQDLGNSKYGGKVSDKLTPNARKTLTTLIEFRGQIAKAKNGMQATSGSNSVDKALQQGILSKAGGMGKIADFIKQYGIHKGQTIIDEAAATGDIRKLNKIIESLSTTQPRSTISGSAGGNP